MGSSFSIVLDGTTYKAGELFDEERRDSYIEKKYEDRFQQLRTDLAGKDSRHMYLAMIIHRIRIPTMGITEGSSRKFSNFSRKQKSLC